MVWWICWFGYLGSTNTNPTIPCENVSFSSPHSWVARLIKYKWKCYWLDAQGSLKCLVISYEAYMCYPCFCSTLDSMLPKFNLIYSFLPFIYTEFFISNPITSNRLLTLTNKNQNVNMPSKNLVTFMNNISI